MYRLFPSSMLSFFVDSPFDFCISSIHPQYMPHFQGKDCLEYSAKYVKYLLNNYINENSF